MFPVWDLLACYGIVLTFLTTIWFIRHIWKYLRSFMCPKKFNFLETGKWAVVTGATDGIGKEYALNLAKRGMNICLISRNETKLASVADDISRRHEVKTSIIAVDFFDITEKIYEDISLQLENLDIGVLVNNVGATHDQQYFHEIKSRTSIRNIVLCNIFPPIMLTHMVLPKMIEKKSGVIVNISSIVACHPHPFIAIYTASKAFVDLFSRSIREEVKSYGITVQTVLPSFISTKLIGNARPRRLIPKAYEYVGSAIKTVGNESRTYGYWSHALLAYLIDYVPVTFHPSSFVSPMISVRKKLLKMKKR
ncbi:DgyrCDS1933 [Dimorphilus gyrociliatus]|uniref:DgyrCDS1933 n=1 Tax=Dimorphilus gyrociliatus TaxID=2664684 RepID=A0A7I8VBW4_9ANNE|nr:DgyrCDS1933 [Dimorphilus gyrociliatus]